MNDWKKKKKLLAALKNYHSAVIELFMCVLKWNEKLLE